MARNCVNHPDSHAVADCLVCRTPVCLMCVEEEANQSFCSATCATKHRAHLAEASIDAPRPQRGACATHPAAAAVSHCQVCDKALCHACMVQTPEGMICSSACLEVLKEVRGWMDPQAGSAPKVPPAPAAVRTATPPPMPRPSSAKPAPELVACGRCGKSLDRAQAIETPYGFFCSAEC